MKIDYVCSDKPTRKESNKLLKDTLICLGNCSIIAFIWVNILWGLSA